MINFLKYRWLSALVSAFIFVAGVATYVYRVNTYGSAFNYSVEFTGGTEFLLKFDQSISASELKNIIDKAGWSGAAVRQFSDKNDELLVRVKDYSNDAKGLAEKMRSAIQESLGQGNTVSILQSEAVGPGVGAALRWQSARAVIIALLAMLLYIAIRFWSYSFAIGAVAALFHDAFVMLFVFMLLGREISVNVIGAILAVLGYSVNDTIVIFSQIRSNLKKMRGDSLDKIVNTSLNNTLRRTLLTSISTALTVGALFFLGGEALRDLSLALLVGIIFGTYSSIYIASPVMMLLYKKDKSPSGSPANARTAN